MKELICPNCHKAFTVDEAGYASIVNQVKNAEFHAEIERRIAVLPLYGDYSFQLYVSLSLQSLMQR